MMASTQMATAYVTPPTTVQLLLPATTWTHSTKFVSLRAVVKHVPTAMEPEASTPTMQTTMESVMQTRSRDVPMLLPVTTTATPPPTPTTPCAHTQPATATPALAKPMEQEP